MATLKVFLHGKEVTSLRLESGHEYVFGRADGCSVQLEDMPGISRQHFKVSEVDGQWQASVLSKFGELVLAGQPTPLIQLQHGSVFKLSHYDFRFLEVDANEQEHVASVGRVAGSDIVSPSEPTTEAHASGTENNSALKNPPAQSNTLSVVPNGPAAFEGNDEATNVGIALPGRPSVRIVKPNGTENRIELEGKKWLAGREDTCEIFLPDRKASRRQFEITSTPEGYFVTDLGSANGTLLNSQALIPDDPRPLKSGDAITVNALQIHFEIRDPNFEKKLVAIPAEIMAAPLPPVARFEIINYPVVQGPGGAVRINSGQESWDAPEARRPKRKKTNPLLLAVVLLAVVGALYSMFGEETDQKPQQSTKTVEGIARLTPQQRQVVKELYVTARNLYMQGKIENAYEQVKKLHEILPEGYEGSKAMEEECLTQRANAEKLAFLEAEQKRVEEQKRVIDRNIQQCNTLANTTLVVEEIRRCLAPTIGLDPANPLVADLIGRVEKRALDQTTKLTQQKDYQEKVDRGRDLFEKAMALQRRGEWFSAIEAFNRHISSSFPDPGSLKQKSQESINKIKTMISTKTDESLAVAQSAYQAHNYKEALEAAKKAKEFDPKSEKTAEFIAKVRKELSAQLRPLYEDAILYEGVGRVQEAQAKWRQIMEKDSADGEYYQKAKSKLRNYSESGP